MSVISVKNLSKTFKGNLLDPKKHALKGITFEVAGRAVTGFVGANGSGKTTSLKCILGFIRADDGVVTFFDGQPLTPDVKRKIGFFPERPYLYEFLTTKEFLRFHWDLSGGGSDFEAQMERVLKEVDLRNVENRRLKSFSKGMLQRVGIAQALLKRPELLILDEPMSGLDPDGRILIKEIIRKLGKEGTAIFFSSHLLHDLEELCQYLVVIDEGEVLFQGLLNDFREKVPAGPMLSLEDSFRHLRQKQRGQP